MKTGLVTRNLTGRLAIWSLGLVLSLYASAQQVITGQVIDEEADIGLPGVTVIIKGTTTGTSTDFDGNYTINASSTDVLVYSFVGYNSQEIQVGAQSIINVSMALNVEQLEEVIVVGYGEVQKKDMTGVVSTVDAEEFNQGLITSPAELLAGKAAGVSVTPPSGPGQAPQVRIRGISSSSGSSDPLYVIDGVIIDNSDTPPGQRNPLNFLNTDDIENITVLKDASAAAIFGSRGAKGVILITTKSGTKGEPEINYNTYFSMSQFTREVENLDPATFRDLIEKRYKAYIPALGDTETIWQDEVLRQAQGMKHALSFSSGDEISNVYISFIHQDLKGVVRHDDFKLNNLSLNYNRKFFGDQVNLRVSLKNGHTQNNFGSNQIGTALNYNPTVPVRDPDSPFGGYYEQIGIGELGSRNPVAEQNLTTNRGRSFRSLNMMEIGWNLPFVDGLQWTNRGSFDISNSDNRYYQPTFMLSRWQSGILTFEEALKTSVLYETYLNYNTTIGAEHTLALTAGYSYQTFNFERSGFQGDTLITDQYTIYDPTVARLTQPQQPTIKESRQRSFFGRINYSFRDKYLLTLNYRADGSSQFGPDNRYGHFPSVAFAWRLYDEPFMAFLTNVFTDLKFRVGYGVLGNQEFDPYLYEKFYFVGTNDARYQFGGDYYNVLRPTAVDPNIKWEETSTFNIGFDYTFLAGRLSGSIEYYTRRTSDLLFDVIIPAGINVGDRIITNIGEMENKGFELELRATAVDRGDLRWDLSFNAFTNNNKILKIDNSIGGGTKIETGGISGDLGQNIQVIQKGEEMNSFSTYEHIYAEGKPVADKGLTLPTDMYVDQITLDTDGDGKPDSPDGIINEDDRIINNSANADLEMGLTSTASYKGFDLSFTMRSKIGNYVYNNVSSANGYFNRVTEIGAPYNIHLSTFDTEFNNKQLFSDYYLENASFLKLDNITLGYNFNKLDFVRIRVYGTAQNVFTLTGYSGIEPEVGNGIDNNLYPRAITFIGGLNLTF